MTSPLNLTATASELGYPNRDVFERRIIRLVNSHAALRCRQRGDDGRAVAGAQHKLYLTDPILAWLPAVVSPGLPRPDFTALKEMALAVALARAIDQHDEGRWIADDTIGYARTGSGNEIDLSPVRIPSTAGPTTTTPRVFGYNEGPFGVHAEYLVVRADGPLAQVPAGVTFEQAAAATEGAHYALAFIRRISVRDGVQILVNGATGAIGSAAVQLLKRQGAQVSAVCGPDGVDLMRGLGVERIIDHTVQDFTRDEHVYDAVLDAVGKSSFGRCRRLLRSGGVYSSGEPGRFGQNLVLAILTPLLRGRKVVFPFPSIDRTMVEYIRDLLASGQFRPLLDLRYPLEQIVADHRYVESGEKIGNVIIVVRPTE